MERGLQSAFDVACGLKSTLHAFRKKKKLPSMTAKERKQAKREKKAAKG
jgi:hypothetical protein